MSKEERLKEVSTETLRESLLALADLRRKYKGEAQTYKLPSEDFDCPLCRMVLYLEPGAPLNCGEGCKPFCPWYFAEGISGSTFLCVIAGYDNKRRPQRLARITRWEKAITAEISAREATHDDQTP